MAKKMATVRYSDDYPGNLIYAQIAIESASKGKIVTTDVNSGDHLTLIGKNLGLDHGLPNRGVIDKMVISDHDGTVLYAYSNLRMNVELISGSTLTEVVGSLVSAASLKDTKYIGSNLADNLSGFQGDDILLGRGGDDTLSGKVGNDRLNGGDGNDLFVFNQPGWGKDRILDFDAEGGFGNQDLIQAVFADATMTQDGANTVLDFGDGDVLTLVNVNTSQIDGSDFV